MAEEHGGADGSPSSADALAREIATLRTENAKLRQQLTDHHRTDPSEDAEFLRSLLAALPVFVMRHDAQLRLRFINQVVPGLSQQETIGRSMFDFIAPEYHELTRSKIEEARSGGGPVRYELVGHGPNGQPAHYQSIVTPVREADGGLGVIIMAIDVTEATLRERSLQLSEENLRVAVEATGIGLWSWDLESSEVHWSPRMHEITGRSQPPTLEDYVRLVHPDDVGRVGEAQARLSTGDEGGWTPHRIVTPAGEVRSVIPCGRVTRDVEGRPTRVVGGTLDVTASRALEARLRQAEKMQSLGTLTAGVAHNVNNMLAVILPTLDELEAYVGAEGKALLRDASVAAQGAAEVVRQLMSFAGKRRESRPNRVRVAEVVESAVEICRRAITGAKIELRLESDEASVRCDSGELRQVIVNLIANARDALQESSSGPPQIRVRVRLASDRPVALAERDADGRREYVCLSVLDNGPGIDRETQRRIFDPFFTTKGPLGGTGLGLATAWSVVTASGGTIECESSPGQGARFRVYLPIAEEATAQAAAPGPTPAEARPLRVLLVEDNEAVRRIVARILRRARHAVIEATTAAEALAARGDAAIDVVLLDQSLPDGRGIRIVPELRRQNPSARILLFTGEDVADDDLKLVDGLISKPVTGANLLRALEARR